MKNFRAFLILPAFFLIQACASHSGSNGVGLLRSDLKWNEKTRKSLDNMIEKVASDRKSHPSVVKPVAAFDWDNTTMKNDVGDAVFFWLVNHDGLRSPANWSKSNPYFTEAALTELNQDCKIKSAGAKIQTTKNLKCADLLISIYNDGKTTVGKPAWTMTLSDTYEPAYLWTVQLMAGYTPEQVHEFTEKALDLNFKNPVGFKQKVGSKTYNGYIRIYEEQKDLIQKLKDAGFDVWIVTASAQAIVEVIAPNVGVAPDHVIGIRPVLDAKDQLTDSFQGCGIFADGNKDIITYRQGKRCWINKEIFKVTDPKAQMEGKSPLAFAAGDSDTDVFFVKDAEYHLAINRQKPELMCSAYQNADHHWMVNAMFIEPKSQKKEKYNCSSYGISDQDDSVF